MHSPYRTGLTRDNLRETDNSGDDPNQGNGKNNIGSLLDADDSGVKLMTGVLYTAPPPVLSHDKIKKFKILQATLRRIKAKQPFPKDQQCNDDWEPEQPAVGVKQWDDVHDKWKKPLWDEDDDSSVAAASGKEPDSGDVSEEVSDEEEEDDTASQKLDDTGVQTRFVKSWAEAFKWDEALSSIAQLPKNMDKRFKGIFVAAPLMTK